MDVPEKMSEAEVSLRLAFYLVEQRLTNSDVHVAIDGAQVKTTNAIHFGIGDFLRNKEWIKIEGNEKSDKWQGCYKHACHHPRVIVHSKPGCGDVVATLINGRNLRVECKKGPLVRSESSQEYPLLREALGQLLTIELVGDRDLLGVAIPSSPKFESLARRWRQAPLIRRFGIFILTVNRNNQVSGFQEAASEDSEDKENDRFPLCNSLTCTPTVPQ